MIAQADTITTTTDATLDPHMMLPDLIRQHPTTRQVFDRYGLSGCGGTHGPVESIRFFARAHGVDESQLLHELRVAVAGERDPAYARATAEPASLTPSVADTIYRRYFMGGIILILTAGATWGAWLLWKIGFAGSFTREDSIQNINAHGHAQIYGWVGLFIMGFASQAFPRIWHTTLYRPRIAVFNFVAMAIGITVRSIAMPMGHVPLAMLGGALEILAVALFAWQIVMTFRQSGAKLEPYIGFALASLFWFVTMSFVDVWHTWTTMAAATRDALLWYVATYQAPLRDMQIHGLALMMILGVCLRMLPGLYDVPKTSDRRAWWALGVLFTAVVSEVVLFIAYRWTHIHWLAALLMVPWIMLAVGCAMVVLPWKLWRPFAESDRSAKFIRTGYGWLAISLAMLLMLPVYQAFYVKHVPDSTGFSHAYYGAIRHAITVGFVSLMIMGFAAKVVPTLNGRDVRQLTQLWGPFILVNVGCFLRVSVQTLTDWDGRFFPIIGISGTLEVIGLAWWGIHLAGIVIAGKRESAASLDAQPLSPGPPRIEPTHHVADVLAWYPATESVFLTHGFTLLKQPLLRRTLARTVTLSRAASLRGVNEDELLASLNQAIAAPAGTCTHSCDGCDGHRH